MKQPVYMHRLFLQIGAVLPQSGSLPGRGGAMWPDDGSERGITWSSLDSLPWIRNGILSWMCSAAGMESRMCSGRRTIIRGIRSAAELDSELQACAANKLLNHRIETLFLPCDPSMSGISSSAVREIAAFGGNIQDFVPDELTEEIGTLLSNK